MAHTSQTLRALYCSLLHRCSYATASVDNAAKVWTTVLGRSGKFCSKCLDPTPAAQVGFIGLGAMGGRMAANLHAAGHELVVLDSSESRMEQFCSESGATAAASPAAVAETAGAHARQSLLCCGCMHSMALTHALTACRDACANHHAALNAACAGSVHRPEWHPVRQRCEFRSNCPTMSGFECQLHVHCKGMHAWAISVTCS